jgi:hypothetical protein
MPTETEPGNLLDDVADACDKLAAEIVEWDVDDLRVEGGTVVDPLHDRRVHMLQALSFYRLAIAVENLGAEATDELMAATVDEAARRGMVPPSRVSSRLPKKHAGG